MPIPIRNTGNTRLEKIKVDLSDFSKGVNKLVEETRLKPNESVEATNLMLVQDGVWQPRWGTQYYTPEIVGVTGIEGFSEYVASDDTKFIVLVGDDGKVYKSVDGGTPTELKTAGGASASFTPGNQCFFKQIGSYLYIANGVDSLVRFDGTNIATYSQINPPAWGATPLTLNTLTTGAFKYYYRITSLNDVGETIGNAEQSITCNEDRADWASGDGITLSWVVAAGASKYQIYIGTESGYLNKANVILPATATTWKDDGTAVINPYIDIPNDNTTGAPKFAHMAVSNNRMWATNDPDNKYRVYFSGTGMFIGFFSDYYGGGWIDLEKGGWEQPKAVAHYIDGSGNGRATAICSTPEGQGSVWQITISSLTVETETFAVPSTTKIVGSVGTNAPLSVVLAGNNVFFANKRGIFSLGPEKNYYGILRTEELTSRIRPYWRNLIGSALDQIAGYDYDAKVFFSVPTTGTTNNRIIYYDRERMAWVVDWSIGVQQFGEYTDASGNSHLLASEAGSSRLIEFNENFNGDKGVAFQTSYISPRIPMGKSWDKFAKVKKAYIRLGNPVGTINFTVSGTQKKEGYSGLASKTITALFSLTGMGWDQMGSMQMGSSAGVPTAYAQASDIRYTKVNKKVRDLQFRVSSNSLESDYQLLGIMAEGNIIQTSPPSDWRI